MEDCHYKTDGKQDYKIVWKYDVKGNEIECCYFDRKGDLYGKDYWIYDAKGNNIEYYEGLRVRFERGCKRNIKSKAGLFHNNSALNVKITFITLYV